MDGGTIIVTAYLLVQDGPSQCHPYPPIGYLTDAMYGCVAFVTHISDKFTETCVVFCGFYKMLKRRRFSIDAGPENLDRLVRSNMFTNQHFPRFDHPRIRFGGKLSIAVPRFKPGENSVRLNPVA